MTMEHSTTDPIANDKEARRAHALWESYLTGDESLLDPQVTWMRRFFKTLPADPRCKVCKAPFRGVGGAIVNVFGFGAGRSDFSPHLCNRCDKIVKKYQVGMEIQLTMLFADVRGSTALAEQIGATAFHHLINRYYRASIQVLTDSGALVNRLIGDALIGLYVPGIAGPDYTLAAIEAARSLLRATGHGEPGGPWIQLGIGVHSGPVYVGAVGASDSVSDITVLGDAANTAARLSSVAKPGEALISEDACRLAKYSAEDCEVRALTLKGRTEPVTVKVLRL